MNNLRNKFKASFWITNVSKTNVCLRDLALTIPAGRSMNLLDEKHFRYTLQELEASQASGSLYKKSKLISVRSVAPAAAIQPGIYISNIPRFVVPRSNVKIKEEHYEELIISDEKFVENLLTEEIVSLPDPNPKKTT